MELLFQYVGEHDGRLIICMSNKQKGITAYLATHFPNSPIRYCARHIFANFKAKFSGVMVRNLYWVAARATDPREFVSTID